MRLILLPFLALALLAQLTPLSTIPQGTRTIEAALIVPTNSAINICRQSTVAVVRATAATLTIANGAGATAPQYFFFAYPFPKSRQTAAATTLTITAGTASGTVYLYAKLNADGTTLSYTVLNTTANTLTCTTGPACTFASTNSSTASSIRNTGIYLWSWTMTTGEFDVGGGAQWETARDCWVDMITVSNVGAATTILTADGQTTPFQLFPTTAIEAGQAFVVTIPGGMYFESGLSITAGAVSSIHVKARFALAQKTPLSVP